MVQNDKIKFIDSIIDNNANKYIHRLINKYIVIY